MQSSSIKVIFVATAVIAFTATACAATSYLNWHGFGKSPKFTVPAGKPWRASWNCEPNSNAPISLLNADNGASVDTMGGGFARSGEKVITAAGNFRFNTYSGTCTLVAVSLN